MVAANANAATAASFGSSRLNQRAALRSGSRPTATASAAAIGSHASGPVGISASETVGIGSHGTTASNAGIVVSGFVRHGRMPAAMASATMNTHHGAATATRAVDELVDATVTVPAAHHAAAAMTSGPITCHDRNAAPCGCDALGDAVTDDRSAATLSDTQLLYYGGRLEQLSPASVAPVSAVPRRSRRRIRLSL